MIFFGNKLGVFKEGEMYTKVRCDAQLLGGERYGIRLVRQKRSENQQQFDDFMKFPV